MAWEGYKKALASDPGGVGIVLATRIKATPERENMQPSMQTELAWVIEVESQWRPDIQNPVTKATGLIQFMPSTAKKLGTTVDTLKLMSRAAQSDYVQDYFSKIVGTTASKIGDIYLMVAAPVGVGKPDEAIIYPVDSDAWKLNPGWRSSGNGPVTAGSIRRVGTPPTLALPGVGEGPQPKPKPKPEDPKPKPASRSSGLASVLLVLGVAYLLKTRRK